MESLIGATSFPRAFASRASALLLAGIGLAASLTAGAPHPPPPASVGSADEAIEYKVKAASLFHFIDYTTWPKTAFERESSPIVLLVVGEDPFGKVLEETLRGKKSAGRDIRVARSKDLSDLPKAHMVFLARSHAKEIGKLMEGLAQTPVLVVGDTEGLAEHGALVNFFLENKRIRFEVNNDAVRRSGLTINPQMLKLARRVKDRAKDEEP